MSLMWHVAFWWRHRSLSLSPGLCCVCVVVGKMKTPPPGEQRGKDSGLYASPNAWLSIVVVVVVLPFQDLKERREECCHT